jgi:hypothetical protein
MVSHLLFYQLGLIRPGVLVPDALWAVAIGA